ncbi:hypothetical protein NE237_018200 [Protea cynaroides]|uniref:Uncharacterized protein n=1 Tax=Protea cynaroides TaxID=273540 RepID=A0A9Q0K9K7_9MAGN|nr:hypothetical protein NE237_018200 [Protea cynaroides]
MNGYSKIKVLKTTKSRSTDFSDPLSPPQSPKPITVPIAKAQETKKTSDGKVKNTNTLDLFPEPEHDDQIGQSLGVILNRSYSVSAASRRFRTEKNNNSVQSAVKRAFSMRSSSTVDGYSRIHDKSSPLFSPTDDDHLTTPKTRSKKKRAKILKACKRLFGL